jgi:ribosomal-protein-alanine N-acetyltransferase
MRRRFFDSYACDPAVAKYMTWRPQQTADETLAFMRRCEDAWRDGSAFSWTLWSRADGELVGLIEARLSGATVTVGYALSRRRWRQGLMSEALGAVVRWALAQPDIYRVWATCDVDNIASVRVMERVGMQREGILRNWLVHPNAVTSPVTATATPSSSDYTRSQTCQDEAISAGCRRGGER